MVEVLRDPIRNKLVNIGMSAEHWMKMAKMLPMRRYNENRWCTCEIGCEDMEVTEMKELIAQQWIRAEAFCNACEHDGDIVIPLDMDNFDYPY